MSKPILLADDLYDRLGSLARPFVDKEPADVIRWLVDKQLEESTPVLSPRTNAVIGIAVVERVPRERGAIVELDGTTIRADSVPDLCLKVMQYLHGKGHWSKILAMSPYKTSAKRYLFSKVPKHPNGNKFWVKIEYRELFIEGHKNYQAAVVQLAKLASKCGVVLTYKGT